VNTPFRCGGCVSKLPPAEWDKARMQQDHLGCIWCQNCGSVSASRGACHPPDVFFWEPAFMRGENVNPKLFV
jgi:hypothetical protein